MSRISNRSENANQNQWSSTQAYVLAVITLVIGFASGYLFRGSGQTSSPGVSSGSVQIIPSAPADAAIGPMLRQLQQTPNDPELLAQIGNTYYDSKSYAQAIEYYRRSLGIRPENVDVRTDMATATWYNGDADGALRELERSLGYQPNHGHTLFNIGIVKWQGKNDIKGALASWNKLLATNPNYPERQKAEQFIQQFESQRR